MASSSNPIAGSSDPLLDRIMQLSLDEQLELLGEVVSLVATKHFGCSVFIRLSMEAMKNLEEAGKKNIIYNLVLGFATKRLTEINDGDLYFSETGSDTVSTSVKVTDESSNYSLSSSDAEEDKSINTMNTCTSDTLLATHTVILKVIGCTKEHSYQEVLKKAKDTMKIGCDDPVKLLYEPTNPFNTMQCYLLLIFC